MKLILIIIGTLSLVIGAIGIIIPGLPTTTFLLIASACYIRSSERMYKWLINHRIFGKFIRDYRLYKAMPLKSKVIALISMWSMITTSILFFIESDIIKVIVFSCGVIGTVIILSVRTLNEEMKEYT
ncbi:MAG: YbaN family protein [Melioribacteraceae bacterium]|nr:YbaN family protein [Melioribacteraceae bacterium]